MQHYRLLILGLLLLACGVTVAQNEPKRGPSTAEERTRFVGLVHKLEQNPLDKNLYADKEWALKWIEDIPDITVDICPLVLGQDFMTSHYKYANQVMGQVVLGNVVFLIEHPDKKSDRVAQYTAGVESALKAYKGILRADPISSRPLEELLRLQTEGKLADFVKTTAKDCQAGEQIGN
jgi:hypothetical protein